VDKIVKEYIGATFQFKVDTKKLPYVAREPLIFGKDAKAIDVEEIGKRLGGCCGNWGGVGTDFLSDVFWEGRKYHMHIKEDGEVEIEHLHENNNTEKPNHEQMYTDAQELLKLIKG
jgi:hypothetical protein